MNDPASNGVATGFLDRNLVSKGKPRKYVVYVPREYDAAQAWPLILFLHGAGERGSDGLAHTEVGIGRAIRLARDRFPAIVVFPQCPPKGWWDVALDDITRALEQSLTEFNIDPARLYLTGISMGGYATWHYGARHAQRFAALMPICGGGKIEDAEALAKIPIWVFHGANDGTVHVEESRRMVEAVTAAGGRITYTEFPGVEHNSWDPAYADEKAVRWLLKQRRSG